VRSEESGLKDKGKEKGECKVLFERISRMFLKTMEHNDCDIMAQSFDFGLRKLDKLLKMSFSMQNIDLRSLTEILTFRSQKNRILRATIKLETKLL
jgi:hypothetical protein